MLSHKRTSSDRRLAAEAGWRTTYISFSDKVALTDMRCNDSQSFFSSRASLLRSWSHCSSSQVSKYFRVYTDCYSNAITDKACTKKIPIHASMRCVQFHAVAAWVGPTVPVTGTSKLKYKIHHLSYITYRIVRNKISFRIVSTNSINMA